MTPLLTTGDVAELVRRSPRTVERWRYNGDGPAYTNAGGCARYKLEDVEAWLAAHYVTPTGRPR